MTLDLTYELTENHTYLQNERKSDLLGDLNQDLSLEGNIDTKDVLQNLTFSSHIWDVI